ncbi:DivIVA domain-containing protein [Laceyella sacchari]|uniref:DivIVA domain-containing protein n=1 Tax=Laceyella sacchari TaxID=37482 RepID=UPI00104A2475|nr:DivIVA domain-containing protein [Laceyella sacchari]
MPGLTARDIHNKEFKRKMRGYDVDEVNHFLDQIIKDYIEFEKTIQTQSVLNEHERYNQIEQLLQQLLYDVQQIREENRQLREQLREQLKGNSNGADHYSQPFYR